jgi:hypothetical protein
MANLRQKTAKSNEAVKRIAKNATKTKKIKRGEYGYDQDQYLGWSAREEQTYIRESGIYDSYSSMKGFDSWD